MCDAVLELDSNLILTPTSDQTRTLHLAHILRPIHLYILSLTTPLCRQPSLWLHIFCLETLSVHLQCMHGYELRLFGAKVFLLLILLMSRIWYSSSRYNLTSLAETCFGVRIEPITFPTPSGSSMCYHIPRTRAIIKNNNTYCIFFLSVIFNY